MADRPTAAAFADLVLDRRVMGPGVVSPELAVAPDDLRAALPPGMEALADLLAGEPLVTRG
ncbi:MAG: hypothetical protein IT294_05570 [Deltaproteobacteria bacterium]|nr:hypothetical protein [Deltaproteobacteria bacterium]